MKLELKHLAPYLPYNLNVLSGDAKEIYQLVGLHVNWQENFNTYDRKIKLSNGEERKYSQNLKYCKPILQPISNIKQDKYIYELYEKFGGGYPNIVSFEQNFIENILLTPYVSLPYEILEFLFENHFDIFGLINQNLAVNFNKP